ncbi:hypothetical protein [Kitasatospora sp. NPDC004272]
MRPYTEVRVGFSNSDYDNVCERYGGGHERLGEWRDLGDLLHGRTGWHFDVVNDGEALWSLGVLGSSLLNISVDEEGGFHCFDYLGDEAVLLESISQVEQWLAPREENAKQPQDGQIEMLRTNDWQLFKMMDFTVRVTWSDGTYTAVLPQVADAAFGSSLPDTLNAAAEMLCHTFKAPLELAPALQLTAELDLSAVQELRRSTT